MTTDKNAAELARENEELRVNAARLKADVEYWKETHDGQIAFTNLVIAERDALKAELTKARELLADASKSIVRHQAEQPMSRRLSGLLTKTRTAINKFLAHQSAPAAPNQAGEQS